MRILFDLRTIGKGRQTSLLYAICLVFTTFHVVAVVEWFSRLQSVPGGIELSSRRQEEISRDSLYLPSEPDQSIPALLNEVIEGKDGPLASCEPTCQVRVNTNDEGPWTLQAIDCHGQDKKLGGDEFYITYTDLSGANDVTAVAVVEDTSNGTYALDFFTSPMDNKPLTSLTGVGTLTVHFQYTCGIGRMAPPSKHQWRNGAYTHTTYAASKVPKPPIRPFLPPSHNSPIDLGKYDKVFALGDSVMKQMVCSDDPQRQTNDKPCRGKVRFQRKVQSPLDLNSTHVHFLNALDYHFGKELRATPNPAVILGSSTRDILNPNSPQGHTFEDHREACRLLISQVRASFPHATLFWKSATAVHIHVVDVNSLDQNSSTANGVNRVRYLSASRARDVYRYQMEVMKELDVPVLDVFNATYLSAHWTQPGDGRHYQLELNQLLMGWFYPGILIPVAT